LPILQQAIAYRSFAFGCNGGGETNPDTFSQAIEVYTRQITSELLTKGKTAVIKGFKSKGGKSFDAALKFDADFQVVFDFSGKKREKGKNNNSAAKRDGHNGFLRFAVNFIRERSERIPRTLLDIREFVVFLSAIKNTP
jgi:hypothetical protein